MRVAHISIIHRPLDTRIFEKQCRDLSAAGYDVHLVVAGAPAEEVGGVRLHSIDDRAVRPPARRQLGLFLRAARRAWRLRPSTFHLHDPHLIPLGLVLKLAGSRVVYDVHEDYPGHAQSKLHAHPMRGRVKALMWVVLESMARAWLDRFVCASAAVAAKFPPGRTEVVRNFPRYRQFATVADRIALPYRERSNTLIYTGYVREIRSFWEIARALELLPDDVECRLRIIGEFRPRELEERARRLRAWDRMELIPWQFSRVIVNELVNAKVGVNLLRPLPNHDDPIRSNKLFEYMAAGIPVIVSDLKPWREIVCAVGCGVAVDPCDPAAIAGAIEDLLGHPDEAEAMGKRGKAAVEAEFNWEGEAPRLLALYRTLDYPDTTVTTTPIPHREPQPHPLPDPLPDRVAGEQALRLPKQRTPCP